MHKTLEQSQLLAGRPSLFMSMALALSSVASMHAIADQRKPGCLRSTDAISGTLRKVTIREPESGKLITNWHIAPSEVLCVRIGDDKRTNVYDIQVEFAASVDLKAADDLLGVPVGVQGNIVEWRHAGDTGDYIVTGATFSDNMNDAGEIRRK